MKHPNVHSVILFQLDLQKNGLPTPPPKFFYTSFVRSGVHVCVTLCWFSLCCCWLIVQKHSQMKPKGSFVHCAGLCASADQCFFFSFFFSKVMHKLKKCDSYFFVFKSSGKQNYDYLFGPFGQQRHGTADIFVLNVADVILLQWKLALTGLKKWIEYINCRGKRVWCPRNCGMKMAGTSQDECHTWVR